jgi:hypothetical protein
VKAIIEVHLLQLEKNHREPVDKEVDQDKKNTEDVLHNKTRLKVFLY